MTALLMINYCIVSHGFMAYLFQGWSYCDIKYKEIHCAKICNFYFMQV